jgi:hypothetical protein
MEIIMKKLSLFSIFLAIGTLYPAGSIDIKKPTLNLTNSQKLIAVSPNDKSTKPKLIPYGSKETEKNNSNVKAIEKLKPKSQFKDKVTENPYGSGQELIIINNLENKDKFEKAKPVFVYNQYANKVTGIVTVSPESVTNKTAPPTIMGNLLVSTKDNEPKLYDPATTNYQLTHVVQQEKPVIYAVTQSTNNQPVISYIDTTQRTLIINNTTSAELLLTVQEQVEVSGIIETENEESHLFSKVPAHSVTPVTIHDMKDGKTLKPQTATFWLQEFPSKDMTGVMFHESNKAVSKKTHSFDSTDGYSIHTVTGHMKFGKHFLSIEDYTE